MNQTNHSPTFWITPILEATINPETICGKERIDNAKIIGITPAWFIRSGRYEDDAPIAPPARACFA